MTKEDHTPQFALPQLTASVLARVSNRYLNLRLLLVAVGFSLCAVAVKGMDLPISTTFRNWDLPGDVDKAIDLSEVFGHSLGAAAILLSVWLLAPARRPAVWVAITITLISGVVANGLKSCFIRVRPHSVDLIRVVDPDAYPPSLVDGVAPLDDGLELVPPRIGDSRQRSFPSGHSATAWGMAIGLSLVFPRGLLLFATFASLACLQRITSGAHFPTDVFAGAAIAFILASILLPTPPLRKLLLRASTQTTSAS